MRRPVPPSCRPWRPSGLDAEPSRGLAGRMAEPTTRELAARRRVPRRHAGRTRPGPRGRARLAASGRAFPRIEVAPVSGKLLNLLVRISGARRVLEIGTLGGYSTIWMARGVGAEGQVVSIEAEPRNAAIARGNIDAAGVGQRVDILIGRAADVLPTLEGTAPVRLRLRRRRQGVEHDVPGLGRATRPGGHGHRARQRGAGGRDREQRVDGLDGARHARRSRDARVRSALRRHRAADGRRSRAGTASRSRWSCDRARRANVDAASPMPRHPRR